MRAPIITLAVLVGAAALAPPAFSQTRATTEDGRKVLLFPDGTWRYETSETRPSAAAARVRYKSPLATMKADLLRGQLVLFYNPAKWKPTPSDDPNKMTFQHANGDGYAMIIAERLQIPLPKLKEVAVINARQAAPNVRVTLEEPIRVNGVDVLGMQMEGTIQGIDFIYYGYYYSGPQGSIQLLTYTGRNLFPEFKADFEEFLNGFQPPGR